MPTSIVIVEIIKHTPLWAWAILALLIWLGSRQLGDHQVGRQRVLLQPFALACFSLWGAASVFGPHMAVFAAWAVGVAAAFALNLLLRLPRRVRYDVDAARFHIGGSPWPLVLMMTVFAVRYAVVMTLVFHQALAGDALFASAACAVYGLLSGLVAARARRILSTAPTSRAVTTAAQATTASR
ncbi:MAG: hypothetical protein JWQ11_1741 [Rhizobacter sp.]|nr:hypothetical protein [Rhizobacter sp.]